MLPFNNSGESWVLYDVFVVVGEFFNILKDNSHEMIYFFYTALYWSNLHAYQVLYLKIFLFLRKLRKCWEKVWNFRLVNHSAINYSWFEKISSKISSLLFAYNFLSGTTSHVSIFWNSLVIEKNCNFQKCNGIPKIFQILQ